MNETVHRKLLALNRSFYDRFAESFAATRWRPQPGYQRIIHYFPDSCQVLDLGCGNGRFAVFLDQHLKRVAYVGLDGSPRLIALARQWATELQHVKADFRVVDLAAPGWEGDLPAEGFDVAVALAVLHHIPGAEHRTALVRTAATLLKPGGYLILSNWRFLHNPRMRRKIVPWQTVGLSAEDVEPGDYLLDWKRDGRGYRYVHQLDEAEVEALAAAAGLQVVEQFHADGREGDLSLYSVLYREGWLGGGR